jgi:hypothetical protein
MGTLQVKGYCDMSTFFTKSLHLACLRSPHLSIVDDFNKKRHRARRNGFPATMPLYCSSAFLFSLPARFARPGNLSKNTGDSPHAPR